MGGYRFLAKHGDDLGLREFSVPNWSVGDTVALRDRVYRVYDVVYLDDDGEVRGMLMLEEPADADVVMRSRCSGTGVGTISRPRLRCESSPASRGTD